MVAAVEPAPVPLAPPWRTGRRTLSEVATAFPAEPIGTLSGVLYGTDRPVRAIVRADCGAGTVLQAVYETPDGALQVTPGMALRFLGLATKRPATYSEGDFEVKMAFDRDDAELLSGSLDITFHGRGKAEPYASLRVAGKPLTTMLEPRVDGAKELPGFEHCMPNGYMRVVEADGTEHLGLVHVTRLEKASGLSVRALLTESSGLRIVIGRRDIAQPTAQPVALGLADARKLAAGEDTVVLVEAWHLAQLAPPAEATGVNLGTERTVQVREGSTTLTLTKPRGRWKLDLTLSDVSIPILIDGPLRGKKLETVQIAAWPSPPAMVPEELGSPPQWWRKTE